MAYPTGFIPVLPLKNTVMYPEVNQPLRVGRDRSVKALLHAIEHENWLVLLTQKDSHKNIDSPQDLYNVGVLVKVDTLRGTKETGFDILVKGIHKIKVSEFSTEQAFFQAKVEALEDINDTDETMNHALLGSLKSLANEVLELLPVDTHEIKNLISNLDDLKQASYLITTHADFKLSDKQQILETDSLKEKVMLVLNLLSNLKVHLKVQADIREKLSSQMGQNQRQLILREQLKAIKNELGEEDSTSIEDFYRKKIDEANMTEEAKKLAEQQLKRLSDINSASPEYHVIRTHLDLLVSLPWNVSSEQTEIDLEKAKEILDQDHYGLDKIKKRILQHLAVLKLKKDFRGSILLFIGPPGVGKTSLGLSISKALGRKYVRVSVGGVRDDAEIRGHRRTYVGALPGRIISGIKKAGENNPVFILDEIDKLTRNFTGDPASALLEVLDPEQNSSFLDHYLDVGFDLSKVFFIATANSLEGIPGPLLDRMEIIEVSGYTTLEKFHIAKKYLIPKQFEDHGIKAEQLEISDQVLKNLISSYTREAGVRDLQRKIAEICRFYSDKIVSAKRLPVQVHVEDMDEIFGPVRFQNEILELRSVPGVVTGMAWTPVGGDILFIESAQMKGKGQLLITGQLGDVMKESAQIALSLLKSRLPFFAPNIDFSQLDLHVHVPAGATPKDGPSAGVTILTSLASLLSKTAVDPKLAMTGEITLRGSVMPVGGIKEKVLSAHRAGVERIILPKLNEKDLRDVPEEVRNKLQFYFVSTVNEVLEIALSVKIPLIDVNRENPALGLPPLEI